MKKLLLPISLFVIEFGFCQSAIKFVDSQTGKPLCDMYSYIFKDENIFENCGGSDENGIWKLTTRQLDSNADYFFSFNTQKYEPIWKKIDLQNKDTLVFYVKKDAYYIENHKHLLYQNAGSCLNSAKYIPRVPRSLTDIPASIAKKVLSHLEERLGDYHKDFHLVGGQIINLEKCKKIASEADMKTAYCLSFSYRCLKSGIGMYASNVELDEFGNVLKSIDFPEIKGKNKLHIIPLSQIKEKAIKEKFYWEETEIHMQYSPEQNILMWVFTNIFFNNNHTFLQEKRFYNAHNGELVKKEKGEGEWID